MNIVFIRGAGKFDQVHTIRPGHAPAAKLVEMHRVTCGARAGSMLAIDEAGIAAVRATIADLSARWEALPVGGRLALGFSHEPGW
jgi:hypothetical protein